MGSRGLWTRRIFQRIVRVSRSYSSMDRDIEEFNQELEEIFGPSLGDGEILSNSGLKTQSSSSKFSPSNNIDRCGKVVSPSSQACPPSTLQSLSNELSPSKLSPLFSSPSSQLTHVDSSGQASMVDVSHKADTKRNAVASGRVLLGPEVFQLVAANKIAKGDVLTVAKIAGIQAAKQTSMLIPLCHSIALTSVDVKLVLDEETSCVEVTAEASSVGPTGVEMEALTAVSVACLTVYDMCKAASKAIKISGIGLLSKSGGKSGDWHRGRI